MTFSSKDQSSDPDRAGGRLMKVKMVVTVKPNSIVLDLLFPYV